MKEAKRIKQIFTIALCISMLSGCATKTQESSIASITPITDEEELSATIKIVTSQDYGSWLSDTLDDFLEIHTKWDLSFETEVVDGNALLNQESDVYIYENTSMDDLADSGVIAELGGETLSNIQENQSESVFDSLLYHGEMYGTVIKTETTLLYYDTSVFEEDDVKDLDTMLEKGKVGIPLSNGESLVSFYLANGATLFGSAEIYREESGVNFSGENALNVTKYLMDLTQNKNFVNVSDEGISDLKEGKVNALFASSDEYASIQEILGENYGVCALPTYTLSKNKLQLKSLLKSTVASVNANSENLKVAVALAGYLAGVQAESTLYEETGYLPSHTSFKSEDSTVTAFQSALDHTSVNRPIFAQMDTVVSSASVMAGELIQKVVTEENASEKTESMNASMNIVQ